jgi:hypothetical protein
MKSRIGLAGLVLALCLWVSVASAADSLNAETSGTNWKFAVRVAGAWDIVRGAQELILHSGLGYNLQLMIPVSGSFAIIGNFGSSGKMADELPQFRDSSFSTYASDLEFPSYRYSAGLRYNTRSLFGWKKVRFYSDLTAGKLHYESNGRALLEDSTGRPGYVWRPKWHDPDLLVEWETGLQMRVQSRLMAEVGIRRYLSFVTDNGSKTMGMDWGFCLGVTVGFGRKRN